MEPALFSPAALFGQHEEEEASSDQGVVTTSKHPLEYAARSHEFPGMVLSIREFAFHEVNANLLWPGTLSFAHWLVEHHHILEGRQILEIGSGTGALSIFLKKAFVADITTSDYDDEVIEDNIASNCRANGLAELPHIRHTWGDPFPANCRRWDLVLASDILLYVKQYPNLIKTLLQLLDNYAPGVTSDGSLNQMDCRNILTSNSTVEDPGTMELPRPCFLMSWRRRLPKEDEDSFFNGCKECGLNVQHLGSRVYCLFRRS